MPVTEKRSQELFLKWCNNQISPTEQEEFMRLIENNSEQQLSPWMKEAWERIEKNSIQHSASQDFLSDVIANAILSKYPAEQAVPAVHRVHFLKTAWFRYAAVILLIAGAGIYLYLNQRPPQKMAIKQRALAQDILPGGNKAILTLCDGSKIVLDSAAPGNLANQGSTKILKLDEGALAYQAGGATGEVLYNTISTPKGGQYRITLPDGSRVWLNAASSIRFPTTFVKDRKVFITGEVYMEIATDKSKPFSVEAADMQIQVLGTSFNINVYADEPAGKTTLIEGVVRIGNALLKPGLAYINGKIVSTDISQDIAWKNGLFNLDNKSLQEVMRQIARWYNVEIVYEGKIPILNMGGKMDRGLNLSDILEFLTKMNIKFRLEGRTLIVTS